MTLWGKRRETKNKKEMKGESLDIGNYMYIEAKSDDGFFQRRKHMKENREMRTRLSIQSGKQALLVNKHTQYLKKVQCGIRLINIHSNIS